MCVCVCVVCVCFTVSFPTHLLFAVKITKTNYNKWGLLAGPSSHRPALVTLVTERRPHGASNSTLHGPSPQTASLWGVGVAGTAQS